MRRWGAMAWVLVALAGCSGDGMVEVAGKVSLDGQPIEKGTIRFEPAGVEGPTAEAPIIDGTYAVRAVPGKKTVRISGYEKVGEYRLTPDSPLIDQLEPIVPAQFNERSTLEREIVAGEAPPLDFELESK